TQDEYDGYRPPQDTPFDALPDTFEATRAETIKLLNALKAVSDPASVHHNDYGPLTVNGWLKYLDRHANLSAMLVR
ncbi:MAG: hypothetical protein AAF125_13260, partial [Chloroflexota bacterium]